MIALLVALAVGQCGVERQAAKVSVAPPTEVAETAPATVEALASLPNRSWTKWSNSAPRSAQENTAYQVSAKMTGWKLEADLDWHVVIEGDSGNTMVIEFPDPSCAPTPAIADRFRKARAALLFASGLKGPRKGKLQKLSPPIRLTFMGWLFFDKVHGQDGVAPNGVELHPANVVTVEP